MSSGLRTELWQLVRFVGVGFSNTVVTYLLMLGLALFMSPGAAFTLAFLLGVAYNSVAVGPLVFGATPQQAHVALYALWLVMTYLVGMAVLKLAWRSGVDHEAIVLATPLVATVPLSFAGAWMLLGGRDNHRGKGT